MDLKLLLYICNRRSSQISCRVLILGLHFLALQKEPTLGMWQYDVLNYGRLENIIFKPKRQSVCYFTVANNLAYFCEKVNDEEKSVKAWTLERYNVFTKLNLKI